MNRLSTAFLALVEAVITVAVGVGLALVPFVLLWGVEYGLQVPFVVFWRGAADVWLIGHGVDVRFMLDAATAKASGLSGASAPITVTIAALGFAILTAWLGGRAGRRFAETEHRAVGVLVSILTVGVLGLVVAVASVSSASRPSIVQAVVLPMCWYGIPAVVMAEVARRRRGVAADPVTAGVVELILRIPGQARAVIAVGLRGGAIAASAVVTVAAILVTLSLLGSYASVITLYERSHAGVVGGLAMTMGQIAFVPDFVGWATAWIVGPGFAFGTGSSVSPIGTALGPIPAIPVLGALPHAGHTFGLLWVLVPVIAGFVIGTVLRSRLAEATNRPGPLVRTAAGAAIGITGGLVLGAIAIVTAGSAGPGRLATVGAAAGPVGALAALEIGVPAIVAMLASRFEVEHVDVHAMREGVTAGLRRTAATARARVDAARRPAAAETEASPVMPASRPVPGAETPSAEAPISGVRRAEVPISGVPTSGVSSSGDDPSVPGGFPWRTAEYLAPAAGSRVSGPPPIQDETQPFDEGAPQDEPQPHTGTQPPAEALPHDHRYSQEETQPFDDEAVGAVRVPDDDAPWWRRLGSDR
ncbi:cell division protein PerM [Curtobacterium ammoniigenes]|uniref:cell division protein PerM n=1 Tax=Curtobacterium ammoniigenes TaxID=395387 RepID=UPI00083110E2|nr:DUF6350 family protein [Curtobacterium ammoniigenes]